MAGEGLSAQDKKEADGARQDRRDPRRGESGAHEVVFTLIAGIVALIVIAGGAWYFLAGNRTAPIATTPPSSKAAHLSVVVLPFTNLSNDPSQDYFADGITENLTTDLSRILNSFVIARNTAFTFKGKAMIGAPAFALISFKSPASPRGGRAFRPRRESLLRAKRSLLGAKKFPASLGTAIGLLERALELASDSA